MYNLIYQNLLNAIYYYHIKVIEVDEVHVHTIFYEMYTCEFKIFYAGNIIIYDKIEAITTTITKRKPVKSCLHFCMLAGCVFALQKCPKRTLIS